MQTKTHFMKNLEVFQKYNINDKILLKDSSFCIIKNFDGTRGHLFLYVFNASTHDYCIINPDDVAMIIN